MKDDTWVYLAIGGVALYLFTRPKTPAPYATGQLIMPVNSHLPTTPVTQSQGLLLPLLSTVAKVVNNYKSPANQTVFNPVVSDPTQFDFYTPGGNLVNSNDVIINTDPSLQPDDSSAPPEFYDE